jgi:hypothetical protein
MPTGEDNSGHGVRAELIAAIKTPLGFFSLVILVVVEGVLAVAASASGTERTFIFVAMVSVVGLLVVIVAYLAYSRPEALAGKRSDLGSLTALKDRVRQLQTENQQWSSKYKQLEEQSAQLRTRLNQLTDLKSRIYAYVAGYRSASAETILRMMYPMGNCPWNEEQQVQSLITALIDEGRIEPDTNASAGFFRVKKPNS